MISRQEVGDQLSRVGCNFRFWGRAEAKELSMVLMPGEVIVRATNGHYEDGFAMLVATDQRLILIDRKPMFLTIEAMSYDMIAEVNFNHRLVNATLRVFTVNKSLIFTSWNHHHLRAILLHTQQQISTLRQQYMNNTILSQQVSEQPQPAPQATAYQALQPAVALHGPLAMAAQGSLPRLPFLRRR